MKVCEDARMDHYKIKLLILTNSHCVDLYFFFHKCNNKMSIKKGKMFYLGLSPDPFIFSCIALNSAGTSQDDAWVIVL